MCVAYYAGNSLHKSNENLKLELESRIHSRKIQKEPFLKTKVLREILRSSLSADNQTKNQVPLNGSKTQRLLSLFFVNKRWSNVLIDLTAPLTMRLISGLPTTRTLACSLWRQRYDGHLVPLLVIRPNLSAIC